MFLGSPSTKIAQTVPLQTEWPEELKIEKKTTFRRLLCLNQWVDIETIIQDYPLGDPLSELPKLFCSLEQDGRQS